MLAHLSKFIVDILNPTAFLQISTGGARCHLINLLPVALIRTIYAPFNPQTQTEEGSGDAQVPGMSGGDSYLRVNGSQESVTTTRYV